MGILFPQTLIGAPSACVSSIIVSDFFLILPKTGSHKFDNHLHEYMRARHFHELSYCVGSSLQSGCFSIRQMLQSHKCYRTGSLGRRSLNQRLEDERITLCSATGFRSLQTRVTSEKSCEEAREAKCFCKEATGPPALLIWYSSIAEASNAH